MTFTYGTLPKGQAVPAVFAAKLKLMGLMGLNGISKDTQGHGYKCRTIVQALTELNVNCVECGLAFSQSEVTSYIRDHLNAKGEMVFTIASTFAMTLVSTVDGSYITDNITAYMDTKTPDKAAGILSSYALKEWLFKSCAVPDTGIMDTDYEEAVMRAAYLAANTDKPEAPAPKAEKKTRAKKSKEPEVATSAETTPVPDNKPTPKSLDRYSQIVQATGVTELKSIASTVKEELATAGYSKVDEVPEEEWDELLINIQTAVAAL